MTDWAPLPASDGDGISRRGLLQRGFGLGAAAAAAGWLGATASEVDAASILGAVRAPKPTVKPKIDGDLSLIAFQVFIPDSVVHGFEKEYKVKVTQTFISSDQEYIAKLSAGIPFDLVKSSPLYLSKALAG